MAKTTAQFREELEENIERILEATRWGRPHHRDTLPAPHGFQVRQSAIYRLLDVGKLQLTEDFRLRRTDVP